jgi:hypothetical protein
VNDEKLKEILVGLVAGLEDLMATFCGNNANPVIDYCTQADLQGPGLLPYVISMHAQGCD